MIDLDEVKARQDLVLSELEGGLFGGDIRVVKVSEDDLLFNAKDCALLLEYKNTRDAIKHHVADEFRIKLQVSNFLTSCFATLENRLKFPNRGAIFLTEQGLYQLINGSKMAKAQEFQKWVTEVLVTFRKTGKYDKADFAKSKYKKTIKQLPGYYEDEEFKQNCKIAVHNLAKEKGELTGKIWNRITNILFEHFDINILREITKFTKKNKLDKRPNTREYLDIAGYHAETYLAFEILRHHEGLKVNPDNLAYVIGMCQHYYCKLTPDERYVISRKLLELFDKGILVPADDYEIIDTFTDNGTGMKSITFKE